MLLVSAVLVGLGAADCASQCGSTPSSTIPILVENYLNETALLGLYGGTPSSPVFTSFTSSGDFPNSPTSAILSAPCTTAFNSHCTKGCNTTQQQCLCSSSADCPSGADCVAGGCRTSVCLCYTRSTVSVPFNIFPRTGCSGMPSAITCATGDCGSGLQCSASASPPATIFEGGWTGSPGGFLGPNPGLSVYDVSMVSGYNVDVWAMIQGGCNVVPMSTMIKPAATIGWMVTDTDTINKKCPSVLRKPGSSFGCNAPQKMCGTAPFCSTAVGTYTDCNGMTQTATAANILNAAGPSPSGFAGVTNFPPTYTMVSPNAGNAIAFSDSDCFAWGQQQPTAVVFTNLTYNTLWQATGQKMCLITNSSLILAASVSTAQGLGGSPGTVSCSSQGATEGSPCAYGSPTTVYTYRCRQAQWTTSNGGLASQYLCVPPLDPGVNTGMGQCSTLTPSQAMLCASSPTNCLGQVPYTYGFYAGVGGPVNPVYAAVAKQISNPPFYELFKSSCPTCYSYSYDDLSSSFGAFDPGNTAGRYVPRTLYPLTAVTVRFGVAAGGLNIMDQARTTCGPASAAVCPFEMLPGSGKVPPVACLVAPCDAGRQAGRQLRVTPAVDCKSEACCAAAYNAAVCGGVALTSCFCGGATMACPTSCKTTVPVAPVAPQYSGKDSNKGLLGLLAMIGIVIGVLIFAACIALCVRARHKAHKHHKQAPYKMPSKSTKTAAGASTVPPTHAAFSLPDTTAFQPPAYYCAPTASATACHVPAYDRPHPAPAADCHVPAYAGPPATAFQMPQCAAPAAGFHTSSFEPGGMPSFRMP